MTVDINALADTAIEVTDSGARAITLLMELNLVLTDVATGTFGGDAIS